MRSIYACSFKLWSLPLRVELRVNVSSLICLMLSLAMPQVVLADDTENAPYTAIDPARVVATRTGSVTHGYHPDVMTYYRSEVSRNKNGKLKVEGSSYIGDPDFDWEPTSGFYAFCKGNQINLGISHTPLNWGDVLIDFDDTNTNLLFKLDNKQRFYTEVETLSYKRIGDMGGGLDTVYFRPTKAMITALKKTKAGTIKISSTGILNQIEKEQEGQLMLNGFSEMLTRVMTHCPVTAEEIDISLLAKSDKLTLQGQRFLDIEENDKGVNLLIQASEMGNAQASNKLGDYYQGNYNLKDFRALSDKYYQIAAERGNANAQCSLAVGILRKEQDDAALNAKAKKLLEKALEQDAQCASYNLGYMYLTGMIVKKDVDKARSYLKHIAKQSPGALDLLVGSYRNGPKSDDKEAYPWVKLMQERHGFSHDLAYYICKRSPELCKQ